MKVRDEIQQFASEEDKPILLWLVSRYHWQSQWNFVATCTFERIGDMWKSKRIWKPTQEGVVLYNNRACFKDK